MRIKSPIINDAYKIVKRVKSLFLNSEIIKEKNPQAVINNLKIGAFVFLSHSEIQQIVEDDAKKQLEDRNRSFINNQDFFKSYEYFSFISGDFIKKEDELYKFQRALRSLADGSDSKTEIIGTLISRAKKYVTNNNGIKFGSFYILCKLSGFNPCNIDPVLISDLDTLGATRGDVAHKSTRNVTSLQSPSVEWERIDRILNKLDEIYSKKRIYEH